MVIKFAAEERDIQQMMSLFSNCNDKENYVLLSKEERMGMNLMFLFVSLIV